jgi:hypothetical protein
MIAAEPRRAPFRLTGKRPPYRRSIKANRRNTMKISTRLSLAALAAVIAASLSVPSFANSNAPTKGFKSVERAGPAVVGKKRHPPLDLTVCDPAHKNYDIDKCLH